MLLRLTAPADRDIDDVLRYGRKAHGGERAERYLLGLLEELDEIAAAPFQAQLREEADPPVRLRVYVGHNILYDVLEDEVVILRILHHSVNWIDEL